jgi:transcriptional regulator with XRE-family HTH domain
LNSTKILEKRLNRSREARAQFVSSQIDKGIAYQIRALRDRQDLSQEKLSEIVGMNQNAISRLESPKYGRPTISTLKRLAAALDVGLIVRFVPFSHLVNWVSGTPFVEEGLSTETMAVPSFEEEKEKHFDVRTDDAAEISAPVPKQFTNDVTDIGRFREAMSGGTGTQAELTPPQTSTGQRQLAKAVGE